MKRYYIDVDNFGRIVEREHPEGEWVKWEDVKAILDRRADTRRMLDGLFEPKMGTED